MWWGGGERDIRGPWRKDPDDLSIPLTFPPTPPAAENAGTSTEESSEEEEEDEDPDGCAENDGGEEDSEDANEEEFRNESQPGPEAELSKGKASLTMGVFFRVQLEGEGTYECSITGLVFEASERVLVRYSVLSWSKFGAFLPDSWKFAGPIFNVDTVNKDASVLKSIQFPHSVCLADPENEMSFSVLHVKDNRPLIEPTVDHSGSHVKWNVTSLSPVGPIIQTSQSVEHHGVVLVYKQLRGDDNNNNYSFHIYLATNSASDIKDIGKQVRSYKSRYIPIDKPPTCKLDEGTYRLVSEPEGDIKPQDLKFTLAVTKMKGYFEAFFEEPPPFKLSLIENTTEETVWSATIREGDCVDNTEKKPRKRTHSRQRSSSPSEEESVTCKKPRWQDESDGQKTVTTRGQDMSEKQLLQVAKRLGKEWKQVAIFLDLATADLDDIQAAEKDVTMQKLKMLVVWKSRRRQGEATAYHLWKSLEELDDLPNEVQQMLQGNKLQTHINT
ncbi:hypothetical protein L3Q82_018756, partial [Scortum barcoo]